MWLLTTGVKRISGLLNLFSQGTAATGEVVDVVHGYEYIDGKKRPVFIPIIECDERVQNKRVFNPNFGEHRPPEIGKKIEIRYSQDYPEQAVCNTKVNLLLSIGWFLLGLLLSGWGGFIFLSALQM